ncbi:biotin/lipoyl-binding protein [Pseudonocardia acaciae]|uniref:HlyD family efflux transporter periplasmic adaptor subunit n=1 Tax=Pseudonocardia acaciae TaxID=551276 RepID=UPI0005658A50|nr:HlyD family efflux transporter periplasmic adaptor subunit [Pseudonocardia acaciae]
MHARLEMIKERAQVVLGGRRGWWVAGLSLALPVALVAVACGTAESTPTSVRVQKGSVARVVSATGTLQAITEQKLGFTTGGRLTQVLVAVGQQVKAGQPLATIDDLEAKADLQQAEAKLAREQAGLDRIKDGNKTDATADDYSHAKDVLGATEEEGDKIDKANSEAIDQIRKQLDEDRDSLAQIRAQAAADQDKCNRSITGNSHRYDGYGDNADVHSGRRGLLLENPLNLHAPSCEKAEKGKSALASYQRRISEGERDLQRAERRRETDKARQKVSVENARRDATAAGHDADAAESDRPHDIDEQAANVSAAAADVLKAKRAVEDTTLIAPVPGVVGSINGAPGEHVGSGSGTTPLAPGGRTALPDMDSGVGAKDSGGSKEERPGADSFIVLKNVNSFQVVVPFEEADAASIKPNQKVNVTFDAVPGLTSVGTVTSVAPTGTQIKDVTNYYVTVVLTEADSRLHGGQTAEAGVVVGGVDNVLVVPTAAVQRGGQTGVVQVLQKDGTVRRVQVQLGMVGDRTVEIVSGLTEGQRVVIPET